MEWQAQTRIVCFFRTVSCIGLLVPLLQRVHHPQTGVYFFKGKKSIRLCAYLDLFSSSWSLTPYNKHPLYRYAAERDYTIRSLELGRLCIRVVARFSWKNKGSQIFALTDPKESGVLSDNGWLLYTTCYLTRWLDGGPAAVILLSQRKRQPFSLSSPTENDFFP